MASIAELKSQAVGTIDAMRDELIRIGENVVIRVIRTGKSSVKIGVDAPPSVRVVRGELNPFVTELVTLADAGSDAPVLHH